MKSSLTQGEILCIINTCVFVCTIIKEVRYMGRYIAKRVLLAILTIFIICAITFFLMHAIPGGPFNREKALSEATIQALRITDLRKEMERQR